MSTNVSRVIECVPNFSEGRNASVINSVVEAISSSEGACVLGVEPGEGANRTVITFAGSPEAVVEGAFRAVRCAAELIDMRTHHGAHPRIGATDVLPLVPVSGITLEECAELARALAKRIFEELGIPCYCYEAAAYIPSHQNLAICRNGEYEGLPEKISDPVKGPDFGPGRMTQEVLRSGASVVGARKFLIAVNFNLNSDDVDLAREIACDVRTKGRKVVDDLGKPVFGSDGRQLMRPGSLKGCKAIGWYIEEYGIAQVSMNIVDIDLCPLHVAYEEVCRAAALRGAKITGTEIIGLVPLRCMLEAGNFYSEKMHAKMAYEDMSSSAQTSEEDLIDLAVSNLHLDDLRPFNPEEKILEWRLEAIGRKGLPSF